MRRLDRHELLNRIGRGGVGEVYEARDLEVVRVLDEREADPDPAEPGLDQGRLRVPFLDRAGWILRRDTEPWPGPG